MIKVIFIRFQKLLNWLSSSFQRFQDGLSHLIFRFRSWDGFFSGFSWLIEVIFIRFPYPLSTVPRISKTTAGSKYIILLGFASQLMDGVIIVFCYLFFVMQASKTFFKHNKRQNCISLNFSSNLNSLLSLWYTYYINNIIKLYKNNDNISVSTNLLYYHRRLPLIICQQFRHKPLQLYVNTKPLCLAGLSDSF